MFVVDLICIPLLFARVWFRQNYNRVALNTFAQTQDCTHFGSSGIQDAIDDAGIAGPNKSILIKDGIYDDVNLLIHHSNGLELKGENKDSTILQTRTGQEKIIMSIKDSHNIYVKDLTIERDSTTPTLNPQPPHLISIRDSHNISVENSVIKNGQSDGIAAQNVENLTIIKNMVSNNTSTGISCYSGKNSRITGNLIKDNGGNGIKVSGAGITISNNIIQSSGSSGLGALNAGIEMNPPGGSYDEYKIINNTLINNEVFGMKVNQPCEDIITVVQIVNNIVIGTNRLTSPGQPDKYGIPLAEQILRYGMTECDKPYTDRWSNDVIKYNLFSGNTGGNKPCFYWANQSACMDTFEGKVIEDPMFVSSTDFRLQPGSPAIDSGDPSIFDADGSRSDMGAFGGPGGVLLDPDMACSVDDDCPSDISQSVFSCVEGQRKESRTSSSFSCDTQEGVCVLDNFDSVTHDAPCGFEWRGGDSPWVQQTCRDGKCFSSLEGRTDLQCPTDLTATQQQDGNKVTFKWRGVASDSKGEVTGYILRVNSDPSNNAQCKNTSDQTIGWFCKTGDGNTKECLVPPCDDRWIVVKTNEMNSHGMIEYVISDLKDQVEYAWSVQTIYNNESVVEENRGCISDFKGENVFTFNDSTDVPKPVFEPISGTKFLDDELKVKIKAPNDLITKLEYKINNGELESITTGDRPLEKEITLTGDTTIEAWAYINQKKSEKATANYSRSSITNPSGLSHSCHEAGQAVTFSWNDQDDAKAYLIRINRDESGTSSTWNNFDPSDVSKGDYIFFVDTNTAYVPYIQAHTQYASWTVQPLLHSENDPGQYDQTLAFEVSGGGFMCSPQGPDIPLVNPYETPTFLEGIQLTGSKPAGAAIWEAGRNQIVPADSSTTWLANLSLEIGTNQFHIFAVNNGAESARVPVTIQRCLFADIDCSGVVDIRDFSLYIRAMNWQIARDRGVSTHYQNYKLADLNQDGRVDIGDFALFKQEYLKHN